MAFVGVGMAATGAAQAATYNIMLKAPGSTTPVPCATGGFTFTKNAAGSFGTAVTVKVGANCVVQPGTYSGTLNVVVEDVTLNGQAQGPNVVGLSGTLPRQGGANSSALGFAYTTGSASSGQPNRPLTLTAANGSTASGAYHLRNTKALNAVPEPGAVWLVLAGLTALFLAGRRRIDA